MSLIWFAFCVSLSFGYLFWCWFMIWFWVSVWFGFGFSLAFSFTPTIVGPILGINDDVKYVGASVLFLVWVLVWS